jgi:hypothetical protein
MLCGDPESEEHAAINMKRRPASSASKCAALDASFTTLNGIPPSGMQARWLVVQDCGWLIDDWLPASSRACIYYLDAKAGRCGASPSMKALNTCA